MPPLNCQNHQFIRTSFIVALNGFIECSHPLATAQRFCNDLAVLQLSACIRWLPPSGSVIECRHPLATAQRFCN